jgi:CelD/BcsL family acetyltransferase involved in cellulose biosynthesis
MNAVVHKDPDAIDALGIEWRRLSALDPAATVFHRPEFARIWWAEFTDLRELRIVEVRNDGDLRGVAAMSAEPDGVLRFLGDLETTDYLGPVARPEDRAAVAAATIDAAISFGGWSLCEMHGLVDGLGWEDALGAAAEAAGLGVERRAQDVCPQLALPPAFDDYLAALPGKLRHEIRRKARRLERDAGAFVLRVSDAASLGADLERFFDMHRSSDGPKGKFMHEGMASFFTRLAETLMGLGELRLTFLEIESRPVAGAYCFVDRGSWAVYNSAFDHAHRELSPGMVLVGELVRVAIEERCHIFDFMRGSEEYKYRFGARDVGLVQLTLRRPAGGNRTAGIDVR